MNKQLVTFDTMREDHQHWNDVRKQWRRDIEHWQGEHNTAAARLAEMQKVIQKHGRALDDHARSLTEATLIASEHERQMEQYASGKGSEPQDVLANHHQDHSQVFAREQEAHDRVKKHHEAVLAQLRCLEAAAGAAM